MYIYALTIIIISLIAIHYYRSYKAAKVIKDLMEVNVELSKRIIDMHVATQREINRNGAEVINLKHEIKELKDNFKLIKFN